MLTPSGQMPALYTIDTEHRVVRLYAWGTVTDDGARRMSNQIRSDPLFDPAFSQLSDFRDVTGVELTHDAIASLAAEPMYDPDARRAIVVSGVAHYGIARMFVAYATIRGQNVNVFRDVESAEAWLGLPPRSNLPDSSDP